MSIIAIPTDQKYAEYKFLSHMLNNFLNCIDDIAVAFLTQFQMFFVLN